MQDKFAPDKAWRRRSSGSGIKGGSGGAGVAWLLCGEEMQDNKFAPDKAWRRRSSGSGIKGGSGGAGVAWLLCGEEMQDNKFAPEKAWRRRSSGSRIKGGSGGAGVAWLLCGENIDLPVNKRYQIDKTYSLSCNGSSPPPMDLVSRRVYRSFVFLTSFKFKCDDLIKTNALVNQYYY
ncbi:hypothetical protein J6590_049244 [Homalodisca vitripennis]|nr:hypothetical protein J6590_049244 [Homalodisca vitripennis]